MDFSTSHSSSSPGFEIHLNHDRIVEVGLNENQVQATLESYFSEIPLSIAPHEEGQYGVAKIYISISRDAKKDISQVRAISWINNQGKRISLNEIADIRTGFKNYDIYTDERTQVIHLYAEMGSNSVIYPIFHLYSIFGEDDFEKSGYRKISASPYKIGFEELSTGKKYEVEWDGEWKLTMDTFRDLGLAMIFSLFVIYFIIVTQFGSFMI